MKTSSLLDKFVTVILGVFCVVAFCFQFYAIDKGFDITDEGYNLQLVSSRFVGISNTYFFEWVKLLFGWLPNTLLANRVCSTLILLIASAWFGLNASRYFKLPISPGHVFFYLLSVPFAVTLDAVTLSYNNTTSSLVLFTAGCFLNLLQHEKKTRYAVVLAVITGVFASMACITKITSGLLLTMSIPVLWVCFSTYKWRNILLFALGWIAYQIIHGLFFTPFYVQVKQIVAAGKLFEQMDAHYNQYALMEDVFLFLKACSKELGYYLLVLVIARFLKWKPLKIFLQAGAVLWFSYTFYNSQFQLTGLVYVSGSLLCIAIWLANTVDLDIMHRMKSHVKEFVLGIWLWMLPLLVVAGTNNVYYHNYVFAAMPLGIICLLTLHYTDSLFTKPIVLLVVAACITYVSYTKILFQPYRILPLAEQTVTVTEGVLKGIKLDHNSKERLAQLKTRMEQQGFTPQNGLVCLGKMQGIQYYLEASSPGGVMFSPTFKELYLANTTLDSLSYQKPYYVLSDYRFADSLQLDTQNWENRFTATLSNQMKDSISWILVDSIPFETAPLGVLYLYQSNR